MCAPRRRLRNDQKAQAEFAALGLDAAVVAAYGLILPQAMLDSPKRGCLNIHASLLPRWRGAGPIQAAVLAGDSRDRRHHHADGGRVGHRPDAAVEVGADRSRDEFGRQSCTTRSAALGRPADPAHAGRGRPTPTAAAGDRGHLCAETDPGRTGGWTGPGSAVETLDRQVRGLLPWPGAWTTVARRDAESARRPVRKMGVGPPGVALDDAFAHRLRRKARCGCSACNCPAAVPMDASALLRGTKIPAGTALG